jgi:hypothetical protein
VATRRKQISSVGGGDVISSAKNGDIVGGCFLNGHGENATTSQIDVSANDMRYST